MTRKHALGLLSLFLLASLTACATDYAKLAADPCGPVMVPEYPDDSRDTWEKSLDYQMSLVLAVVQANKRLERCGGQPVMTALYADDARPMEERDREWIQELLKSLAEANGRLQKCAH